MGAQNEDHMSPDASPGKQSNRTGVRRVNNLPVYIVVSALGVFLLIMVLVAADRAAKQNRPFDPATAGKVGDTSMFAKEIAGDKKDGIVQAKGPVSPTEGDLLPPGSIAIARPANLDVPSALSGAITSPPYPQQSTSPQIRTPREDEADRIYTMKLQQFDEAVKARSRLSVSLPPAAGLIAGSTTVGGQLEPQITRDEALARMAALRQQIEANARDDPTAAYKARLAQIKDGGIGTSGQGGSSSPSLLMAASDRKEASQAIGAGQADRWSLNTRPEAPGTPYTLRAGFVVPATLLSGVNSELPGQIMAQVSQDVYDTPLGRYKLIPQGSRLVGTYSREVAYGQSRVLVAWQRIVFPDGKAMDIGSMPGGDSGGFAGFKDQVNSHYVRLFSSAFLMSAVTAGITMSQPGTINGNARPTASSALSEALGQQLGQVTAQLIAKNLNIAPTLEIRPGYRFNIIVTKDMTFLKPYEAFDY
jgi:type IV secretory pathway VirB10-like protein